MLEKESVKQIKDLQHSKLRQRIQLALLAALLAIFSQISIPMPGGVPMTLQTFALALIAYWAGSRQAVYTVGFYLLMGAIGLPVFAGFRGGFHCFLSPSAGFLFGFIAMVALTGLSCRQPSRLLSLLLGLGGLICCHGLGLMGLMILLKLPLSQAFAAGSLPFLAKDILSLLAARAVVYELDKFPVVVALKPMAQRSQ